MQCFQTTTTTTTTIKYVTNVPNQFMIKDTLFVFAVK
jgi:hypothetical protein